MPYGWYFVIVWFLGFLRDSKSHRALSYILGFSQIPALVILVWKGSGYPSETSLFSFWMQVPFSFRAAYLIYISVCVSASLFALSGFKVGSGIFTEIARYRSIPYLKSICFLFLAVIAVVFLLFLGNSLGIAEDPVFLSAIDPRPLYLYLILIQIIVTSAVLILGRTLVSYEFLTGRVFPQIGLRKEWITVLLLAGALSLVYLALSLLYNQRDPRIFLAIGYTFQISRTFTLRRAKKINQDRAETLRSVLISEDESRGRISFQEKFDFVCERILSSSKALLVSETSVPILSGISLFYPSDSKPEPKPNLSGRIYDPNRNIFYLSGEDSSGYSVAIGIEDPNTVKGTLFLGTKQDGGLYAEEEIELAKAAMGWILDGMSRLETDLILAELQRKRIQEQGITDHKTRQILHDEILPELHSGILHLSENSNQGKIKDHIENLKELHGRIAGFLRELPDIRSELTRIGMLPVLKNLIDSDFTGEDISWMIDPDFSESADRLSLDLQEVVYYAFRESVRNAIKFSSKEKRKISVSFFRKDRLEIEIGNTIGKDTEFESSGQGLKIHRALLKIFGADLKLEFPNLEIAVLRISIPPSAAES